MSAGGGSSGYGSADGGVVQSPVLIGRDAFLALIRRRLAATATGAGHLLFLAGEAGIGKTRLLGSAATHAEINNFDVVRAAAYPGDIESFAGLLLDLASAMSAHPAPDLHDLGERIAGRLREVTSTDGDAHRRRRVLAQDLVDALSGAGSIRPILVLLEDLHWADRFSLDVLAHLATRISQRQMLIAGAYRSTELFTDVPMREVRTRLLSQRLAEEIRLPRLDPGETAAMTTNILGSAPPGALVTAIHERSDGIPLHVEELLSAAAGASVSTGAGPSSDVIGALAVPDTLGDAIRTRARDLTVTTRHVASAAAVIGRSFDFDLLVSVADISPPSLADALRELQDAYLVLPGPPGPSTTEASFDFRHALIRDTLYTDTDLPRRRLLHERVARAALGGHPRHAFVSAHFDAAGSTGPAYRHAVLAAREAATMSAHAEAVGLYRRAIRNAPADLPVPDRAALLAALGDEAAATDDNRAAATAYREAHLLLTAQGDARAAADLAPRIVAVDHLLGVGLDARLTTLRTAMTSLDGVSDAQTQRAALDAAVAAAYMLDRRLDEAIAYSERSGDDGRNDRDALNTATTHGSVLVFAGRMDEGWRILEDAIGRAVTGHQEAEAARSYRMIGSSASVLVEYDRAERWLIEGIAYADRVELANHRHYMAAHLAHVQWAVGQWDAAAVTAHHALTDGRGGITTEITARYVLGYLAMGRGDWVAATDLLRAAHAQGERMAELQRLSPPLWGLAEMARCRGEHGTAIELCERGYAASAPVTDAAYLFPFLLTGVRAHVAGRDVTGAQEWLERVAEVLSARAIPGAAPAIEHGRGLIHYALGDLVGADRALAAAAGKWLDRRRFWERAWVQLDRATVAVKARRRAEAARIATDVRAAAAGIGSVVLIEAADRVIGSFDHRPPPPWEPLSAREYEVACLVADGLTNRQIAETLVLAPKTVSAHIEHILTKLGAARRTEIASWCAKRRH